jgi:hypothetical protein
MGKPSNSYAAWRGPHKISSDDMQTMSVAARPGKTAYEKRNGTHRNRFANRRQDPSRAPKSS